MDAKQNQRAEREVGSSNQLLHQSYWAWIISLTPTSDFLTIKKRKNKSKMVWISNNLLTIDGAVQEMLLGNIIFATQKLSC